MIGEGPGECGFDVQVAKVCQKESGLPMPQKAMAGRAGLSAEGR